MIDSYGGILNSLIKPDHLEAPPPFPISHDNLYSFHLSSIFSALHFLFLYTFTLFPKLSCAFKGIIIFIRTPDGRHHISDHLIFLSVSVKVHRAADEVCLQLCFTEGAVNNKQGRDVWPARASRSRCTHSSSSVLGKKKKASGEGERDGVRRGGRRRHTLGGNVRGDLITQA